MSNRGMISLDTPEQIETYRRLVLRAALRVYVRSRGKYRARVDFGPKKMGQLVGELTGKKYKVSLDGAHEALRDLNRLLGGYDVLR